MPSVLKHWAELGEERRRLPYHRRPQWKAVRSMVAAAQDLWSDDARQLKKWLRVSSQRLKPLKDPLVIDYGAHRWLAADREESYSDWLQWIVEQVREPQLIFKLFAVDDRDLALRCGCETLRVIREGDMPEGEPDHTGRIDLLIQYGNRASLLIEVKKGGAEQAATLKQQGYDRSGKRLLRGKIIKRLLVTSAEKEEVDRFPVLEWGSLCLELRQLIATKRFDTVSSAMMLGFVGAVEQNLIGLSASQARRVWYGVPCHPSSRLVAYVRQFVQRRRHRKP